MPPPDGGPVYLKKRVAEAYIVRNEILLLSVFALFIGAATALVVLFFRTLLSGMEWLSFGPDGPAAPRFPWLLLVLPVLGGLLVGWLRFRLGVVKAGVPEVMAAIHVRQSRLPATEAGGKLAATTVTLGTGGSGGIEGPAVLVGATLGSLLGWKMDRSENQTTIMVASGAAAAIAVAFNTPIAGVIFCIEVLLREFRARSIAPVMVASVVATALSRSLFGVDRPAFVVPQYSIVNYPLELVVYSVLGLIAAGMGLLLIYCVEKSQDFFERLPTANWLKPAIGGLGVGMLLLILPQVAGAGYGGTNRTVDMILASDASFRFLGSDTSFLFLFLLGLLLAKLVATALTIGSGGSAGIFAPALFLGASTGALVGLIVNAVFPGMTADYGAYALVGMAATFAAASRATLTSIIMIFEMTRDFDIILPLMLACVVSTVAANYVFQETVYTARLRREGIRIVTDMEVNVLAGTTVADVMTTEVITVDEEMSVVQVARLIQETGHDGFPVLDADGDLKGVITRSDVHRALVEGRVFDLVADDETREPITFFEDEPLENLILSTGLRGLNHFPIVDRLNPNKLVGFVTAQDLFRAYSRKALKEMTERQIQEFFNQLEAARHRQDPVSEDLQSRSEILTRSLKEEIMGSETKISGHGSSAGVGQGSEQKNAD